jgi:hypothetical protein
MEKATQDQPGPLASYQAGGDSTLPPVLPQFAAGTPAHANWNSNGNIHHNSGGWIQKVRATNQRSCPHRYFQFGQVSLSVQVPHRASLLFGKNLRHIDGRKWRVKLTTFRRVLSWSWISIPPTERCRLVIPALMDSSLSEYPPPESIAARSARPGLPNHPPANSFPSRQRPNRRDFDPACAVAPNLRPPIPKQRPPSLKPFTVQFRNTPSPESRCQASPPAPATALGNSVA